MSNGPPFMDTLRTRITRGMLWIVDALQPESGHAPNELRTDIQPVVDQLQRGWGHVSTQIQPFTWNIAPSTAGATYDLVTGIDVTAQNAPSPDPKRQQVVLSLSVVGAAGARVGDAWLQYRAGPSGTAVLHSRCTIPIDLEDYSAGADPIFDSSLVPPQDWLPWGPLWVPPGFRSQLRFFYGTDGNQTITVSGAVATMAAGLSAGAP